MNIANFERSDFSSNLSGLSRKTISKKKHKKQSKKNMVVNKKYH